MRGSGENGLLFLDRRQFIELANLYTKASRLRLSLAAIKLETVRQTRVWFRYLLTTSVHHLCRNLMCHSLSVR